MDAAFLAQIVSRAVATFPGTLRIVLFGSRARGSAGPDSDVDLLVITPTALSPAQRVARLRAALQDQDASFDLVVLTPDELARTRDFRSGVVARALAEGSVVYEAA